MEHPAFARRHGRKGERLAGLLNAAYGIIRRTLEFEIAVLLEVVGVERDAVVLLRLKVEDLGGNMLDGVKEFSAICGKETGIRTGELELKLGDRSIGRVWRRNHTVGEIQPHALDDQIQQIFHGLLG